MIVPAKKAGRAPDGAKAVYKRAAKVSEFRISDSRALALTLARIAFSLRTIHQKSLRAVREPWVDEADVEWVRREVEERSDRVARLVERTDRTEPLRQPNVVGDSLVRNWYVDGHTSTQPTWLNALRGLWEGLQPYRHLL